MDLSRLVDGCSEEIFLAGKNIHNLSTLVRGNDGKLFFIRLDFNPATKVILPIAFLWLRQLPFKIRPWLDINSDTDFIYNRRDILTALADCCRDIHVININDGFCIADHLDIDKAFRITSDLALDLFFHEFPAGTLFGFFLLPHILRGDRSTDVGK